MTALFLLAFFDRCLFFRALSEAFNTAGRVNQFFFAGIERMASRANFNAKLRLRCADNKCIAASANSLGFGIIFWVDIFFHVK